MAKKKVLKKFGPPSGGLPPPTREEGGEWLTPKKKTIIITIIAIITGIHNPGATPRLAFACTTKRHALIQSIMNNERKTCVQCCTLCVPLAQFCYNCGSRLTADPPSSCDSSSSESSGEEAPVHQDAVAADAAPAPCHPFFRFLSPCAPRARGERGSPYLSCTWV